MVFYKLRFFRDFTSTNGVTMVQNNSLLLYRESFLYRTNLFYVEIKKHLYDSRPTHTVTATINSVTVLYKTIIWTLLL